MKLVNRALTLTLTLLMAGMVLNITWQVISRFLLGEPSTFTDELSRYLMIWCGFLGAAYVTGLKLHPAIDLLSSKFSEKGQKKLGVLIHVIIGLFAAAALVYGGGRLVHFTLTLDQVSAALHLPLAYVYLVIPISGVLIVVYSIQNIKEIWNS